MENKYVEVDLSETDRYHQPCESQESGDNLANIFKSLKPAGWVPSSESLFALPSEDHVESPQLGCFKIIRSFVNYCYDFIGRPGFSFDK